MPHDNKHRSNGPWCRVGQHVQCLLIGQNATDQKDGHSKNSHDFSRIGFAKKQTNIAMTTSSEKIAGRYSAPGNTTHPLLDLIHTATVTSYHGKILPVWSMLFSYNVGLKHPPKRTISAETARPVRSSVSKLNPQSVAAPVAGTNRPLLMPVTKRRRGSSLSIPITLS